MKYAMLILAALLNVGVTFAQSPGVPLDQLPYANTLVGTELMFSYQAGSGGSGPATCARGWCPVDVTPVQIATYLATPSNIMLPLTNGGTGATSLAAAGIATFVSPLTIGDCAQWSSTSGTLVDSGSACGSGGGGGTPGGSTDSVQIKLTSSTFGGILLGVGQTLQGSSGAPTATSTLELGASGTLGSLSLGNATSGLLTIEPVTGALGSVTASLPANTGTVAELNLAQTWSAVQTFGTDISIGGVTAAGATGTGSVVFSASPTITTPTVSGNLTTNITGSTQCVQANSSGVLSGTSAGCGTTLTIAAGTATLGTSSISGGACATGVLGTVTSGSASGLTTSDVPLWGFQTNPTSTVGYEPGSMLTIIAYPQSAAAPEFLVCNNTGGAITPGAVTLNWRVVR